MNAARSGVSGSRDFELQRIRRDYTFAFLTYRAEGTEQRLLAAYELGRKTMASGLSLLELSKVHHEVVAEALLTARDKAAIQDVADAASVFFVEVLSTFEMALRGYTEMRQATVEDARDSPGPASPP